MNKKNVKSWMNQNIIVFAFVALFIVFSILSPAFLNLNNLLNITRQISFRGIAAVGMMMIILTGGIDLSIGSTIELVNVLCPTMMVKMGVHPILAILISLLMSAVVGFCNGFLITKYNIPPMIATMAFMNILYGAAYLISGGQPVFGFSDGFALMGQGYIGMIPIPTLIMILMFVLGAFILKKTVFGRSLYAIGGNEEAVRLSGINVDKVKIMAYIMSSVFACVSGLLMLSRLMSGTPNTGRGFEFEVITAVVLGGVSVSGGAGRLFSVVFGVLIIGILNNGLTLLGLDTYWQYVMNGVVLILAVGMDYASRKHAASVVEKE